MMLRLKMLDRNRRKANREEILWEFRSVIEPFAKEVVNRR